MNDEQDLAPNHPDSPKIKKIMLPDKVKLALLIFLLTSLFVLGTIPHLGSQNGSLPSFSVFLSCGLVMIVFTALLFMILGQLRLGFGKTALVLGFGYNAVLAVIKLFLSPYGLYLSNQHNSFSTRGGDPNKPIYYILLGVLVLLLYVFTFKLVYKHFQKRLDKSSSLDAGLQAKPKKRHFKSGLLIVLAIFGIATTGGGILLLPLLFVPSPVTYLGYLLGTVGVPLLIAILLALFLAYRGFAAVEKQVMMTGNTALLASFFWLGVSLIFLYHIMWVVFMLTLVQIWPFNTYSPK